MLSENIADSHWFTHLLMPPVYFTSLFCVTIIAPLALSKIPTALNSIEVHVLCLRTIGVSVWLPVVKGKPDHNWLVPASRSATILPGSLPEEVSRAQWKTLGGWGRSRGGGLFHLRYFMEIKIACCRCALLHIKPHSVPAVRLWKLSLWMDNYVIFTKSHIFWTVLWSDH